MRISHFFLAGALASIAALAFAQSFPPTSIAGAGGAPTDATYYTSTANGTLSNEVVPSADVRSILDDADFAAVRTTLGLGTSATVNTGTSGATIPLLNGNNQYSGTALFTSSATFSSASAQHLTASGNKSSGTSGSYVASGDFTGSAAGAAFRYAGTWNTSGAPAAFRVDLTNTASAATAKVIEVNVGGTRRFDVGVNGRVTFDSTVTGAGTTGAQTIDKPSGTVNFAAGANSLVVTNNLVTANSIVMCVVRTNDTTALLKNCVPGAGSFTINLNANATAETSVGFVVFN